MTWKLGLFTLLVIIVIIGVLYLFYRAIVRHQKTLKEQEMKKVRSFIEPEVVNLSPDTNQLKNMARNTWLLRQKLDDLASSIEVLQSENIIEQPQNSDLKNTKAEPVKSDKDVHDNSSAAITPTEFESDMDKVNNQLKQKNNTEDEGEVFEDTKEHLEAVQLYTDKLDRFLGEFDIEIVDYTGRRFNEGLNVEVLSYEEDSEVDEPRITETVKPTIKISGKVVEPGKIIVSKSESKGNGN